MINIKFLPRTEYEFDSVIISSTRFFFMLISAIKINVTMRRNLNGVERQICYQSLLIKLANPWISTYSWGEILIHFFQYFTRGRTLFNLQNNTRTKGEQCSICIKKKLQNSARFCLPHSL